MVGRCPLYNEGEEISAQNNDVDKWLESEWSLDGEKLICRYKCKIGKWVVSIYQLRMLNLAKMACNIKI